MSFGKGVNDYLNHYVVVADGKAALIMASEVGLLAVMLASDIEMDPNFRVISSVLAVISIGLAAFVVLPRTPSSGVGLIFWADIHAYRDVETYYSAVRSMSEGDIERAYAAQNFHVSGVLLQKNRFVRLSLAVFFLSKLAAIIALRGVI